MILVQQCLVLKLHVTPIKCNHFLANMWQKKFAVLFCLPTDISEHASQLETFLRHSRTPIAIRAQAQPVVPNTGKYKMIGNININLYFKFITFYLQK